VLRRKTGFGNKTIGANAAVCHNGRRSEKAVGQASGQPRAVPQHCEFRPAVHEGPAEAFRGLAWFVDGDADPGTAVDEIVAWISGPTWHSVQFLSGDRGFYRISGGVSEIGYGGRVHVRFRLGPGAS